MNPASLLKRWLESKLPVEGRAWLFGAAEKLQGGTDADLYRSISLVTRKVGKADLRLDADQLKQATAARAGWDPSEQLTEPAWNQMVLKTLFIGSTLAPVVGLERRANPALARMLCDYAHERWAAGRPISPELWRCVGPHARGEMLQDLARVLEKGTGPERTAAALALASSPDPAAAKLLSGYPELARAVSEHKVSWQALAT